MRNEHPSIINHHQILLKASTLYFDYQKKDAATFIQAVISELGHFLNASIYIYLERDGSSYEIYTSSKEDVSQVFLDQLKKSWTLMRDHVNLETKNQNVFEIKLFDKMKGLMQIVGVEDKQLDPNDIDLVKKIISMITNRLQFEDLSHHIQILQEKNEKLEKTKQQFLANMSHEIKTPLSGIYNAFYLMGSTDLSLEQKEYHQIGTTSIDQLSNILDDLIDIKKMTQGKIEVYKDTFNLEEEMIRVLRMHKSFADEKKLDLKFIFDYRINFECISDYRKIRQIISNLIHNGIKFTKNGSVTLEVTRVDINEETSIHFSIKDTGIGISMDQHHQLFELFYQVDHQDTKSYQGTGVGLPIVDQLVKILSGKIDVSSIENQGTIFNVTIPIEKGRNYDFSAVSHRKAYMNLASDEASHISKMFNVLGIDIVNQEHVKKQKIDYIIYNSIDIDEKVILHDKKMIANDKALTIVFVDQKQPNTRFDFVFEQPISLSTIYQRLLSRDDQIIQQEQYQRLINAYALIVDDNRLNRVALSNILTKLGLKSKQADSGKMAIEILKKEMFDCVLMDIQMPEMDGIEATRRIRSLGKKYQKLPIIAVTANAFLKDYDVMKSSQITDVIFKPINVDHLERVLRKYITSSKHSFVPDDLFVFDENDFVKRFEGSYDIANDVIQTFLVECPKDMKKIEEAIQSQDFTKIEHETHYFKGSCAYLSAKRITWILSYMVEHARSNQIDEIVESFPVLVTEVDRLIELIKEYRL